MRDVFVGEPPALCCRTTLDTCLALVLLYLARYVHRNMSSGNIILVPNSQGQFRGELSNFEHAKKFEDDTYSDESFNEAGLMCKCLGNAFLHATGNSPFKNSCYSHARTSFTRYYTTAFSLAFTYSPPSKEGHSLKRHTTETSLLEKCQQPSATQVPLFT